MLTIQELESLVVDALEDVKGQDIVVFDTMQLTSLFDRIVLASGTSNRQTKALAASVRDKVKTHGGDVISMEGELTGEWVLVDLGDMVVHIMQPAIRAYYRLEEIWGDKPVKVTPWAKLKTGKKRSSSSEKNASDEDAPKAKRTTTKSTSPSKTKKAKPIEVSHDMMAIPTTIDEETPKRKSTRKPTATSTTTSTKKTTSTSRAKKTEAEAPTGAKVKVSATKRATASSKAASTKKVATKAATKASPKTTTKTSTRKKAD